MRLLLVAMLACTPVIAQQVDLPPVPKGATIADVLAVPIGVSSFRIERAGMQPSSYEVEVMADGTGRYMPKVEGDQNAANRKITVSAATLQKLNGGYAAVKQGDCETKIKNIAKTGAKRVAYRWKTGDIWVQCDFNYSDDPALNEAAAAFQAIAETIQAGDRLKYKKRFDHLGLDAELDGLIAQVKQGYAIELQNIAPVLRSIAEDEEFLASSRGKAQGLLTMAVVQPADKAR